MAGRASLVGLDTAGGGLLLGAPQSFVTVDGLLVACVGSAIADHGTGGHNSATVQTGSAFVTIDGVPVAFEGSLATCGHSLTGSAHVTIDA